VLGGWLQTVSRESAFGYLLRFVNAPVAGFKKTDKTTTASLVLRWKVASPAAQ
jgi:hypothetical protein